MLAQAVRSHGNIQQPSISIDEFLGRLDNVRPSGPNRWRAPCPSHRGHDRNLSICHSDDGCILLTCHSRHCSAEDIVHSMGLELSDLFPEHPQRHHPPVPRKVRVSDRDLINALRFELGVVWVVLRDVAEGRPPERDRAKLAQLRLCRLLNALEEE